MPIPVTDRASLIEAATDYMDRPDLEPEIPGFIALAEARFNHALRAREMEQSAVIAPAASSGAIPGDFLEWVAVTWEGDGRKARPAFTESNSPEATYRHRPGGDPQYFTVQGDTLAMVPAKAGKITLAYYAGVPALTEDASTNWLITKAPDAYLYATIAEAYLYMKAPDLVQAHLQLAVDALGAAGIKADTQKLARRPARTAEIQASVEAAARPN